MTGPLKGLRVIEFAGLGPTPFAAMMLADMGAEVLRIDRVEADPFGGGDERHNLLNRSRPAIALDLKSADGLQLALDLAEGADVLLEGFRPGAMEKLGLGPDRLTERNPRLIYGRMTGWGQAGPLVHQAGHDINYLAMSGALYLIGPHDRPPVPPINLAANFGGGGMLMAVGILAALVERSVSGRGQIVDAAMVDGASLLLTQVYAWRNMGRWRPGRGDNLLNGSAYFYRCYRCADDQFIAVGALEPQFHADFVRGAGLDPADFADHLDASHWTARSAIFEKLFLTRSRDAWIEAYRGLDACLTPVLSPDEAVAHPANIARQVHVEIDGTMQPAPAPRFSRTASEISDRPARPGERGSERLRDWGVAEVRIAQLSADKVLLAL